jgi:hypothetical protein
MDLALRFAAAAQGQGLRVLALKGIAIADELYGGLENRPMADVDFLVVDPARFEAAGAVARGLGLAEAGSSDHALVFKEAISGVVLELHVSLTACPGLFTIDHTALWERRAAVGASPMVRLDAADLVLHLALHTVFQHAFAANEYHYGDFARALATLHPAPDEVVARAREWGAEKALAAMLVACERQGIDSPPLSELRLRTTSRCPRALARWLQAQPQMPPPMRISSLAFVRYQVTPSKWGYLTRTLAPKSVPGRTLPRQGAMRRLVTLVEALVSAPIPPPRP